MKNFALKDGYTLSISLEMRELVRDKPDMALAEAFKAGRYHGQQEANNAWAAEANRKGGAVRWARKIKSRGFDRTKTRDFDGKVRERRK